MSEEESLAFSKMLCELGGKVGTDRLETAIQRTIVECRFWPVYDDFYSRIPNDSDPAVECTTYADPCCDVCHGEGWVTVYEGRTVGYQMIDKAGAAKRCECYQRNYQFGITSKRRYGYQPTQEDLAFRGSREGKELYAEFKGMVKQSGSKKEIARGASPTSAELAETLGRHGHEGLLRKGPK